MSHNSEMKYLSDEELYEFIGKKKSAEDEFYHRYKNRVKWLIRGYKLNSLEREDLIQEGMIGLFNAIATFDKSKQIKFSTYATVCIRNRIHNALNALWKQNNKRDNNKDIEEVVSETNLEKDVMTLEVSEKIEEAVLELGGLEKKVLSLYLDKKSYQEIAGELDISPKKVDNILMKIKGNLARKLDRAQMDLSRITWGNQLKHSIHKGLENETKR